MSITAFSFPTPTHFGAGARWQVAARLLQAGFSRPLVEIASADICHQTNPRPRSAADSEALSTAAP